jgi:serine/threonine-protein kinase HipA
MPTDEQQRNIWVYADWHGIDEPTLMGILYANRLRGKEIFSFEYDDNWLKSPHVLSYEDLTIYQNHPCIVTSR